MKLSLIAVLFALTSSFQVPDINFTPESEKFSKAVREYQTIWIKEGKRMIEAMEIVSRLKFKEKNITAIVYEGVSWSGSGSSPMKLRASYPSDVKKATLIHELGHRLISDVTKTKEIDEHRALFLILYDIWVKLYGKDFADKSVDVEKKRKGLYDYESAWSWALSFSEKERALKFRQLVSSSRIRSPAG